MFIPCQPVTLKGLKNSFYSLLAHFRFAPPSETDKHWAPATCQAQGRLGTQSQSPASVLKKLTVCWCSGHGDEPQRDNGTHALRNTQRHKSHSEEGRSLSRLRRASASWRTSGKRQHPTRASNDTKAPARQTEAQHTEGSAGAYEGFDAEEARR